MGPAGAVKTRSDAAREPAHRRGRRARVRHAGACRGSPARAAVGDDDGPRRPGAHHGHGRRGHGGGRRHGRLLRASGPAGPPHRGRDFVENDDDPKDGEGHGTHVAGIVAANTGNGVGVESVAPGAKVLVVRVLGDDGSGSTRRRHRRYRLGGGARRRRPQPLPGARSADPRERSELRCGDRPRARSRRDRRGGRREHRPSGVRAAVRQRTAAVRRRRRSQREQGVLLQLRRRARHLRARRCRVRPHHRRHPLHLRQRPPRIEPSLGPYRVPRGDVAGHRRTWPAWPRCSSRSACAGRPRSSASSRRPATWACRDPTPSTAPGSWTRAPRARGSRARAPAEAGAAERAARRPASRARRPRISLARVQRIRSVLRRGSSCAAPAGRGRAVQGARLRLPEAHRLGLRARPSGGARRGRTHARLTARGRALLLANLRRRRHPRTLRATGSYVALPGARTQKRAALLKPKLKRRRGGSDPRMLSTEGV